MTVAWVAGTTTGFVDNASSISQNTPSGILTGDTILAAVMGRAALTAPSGWSLVVASAVFTGAGGISQHFAVYKKDTVTAADSNTSFTFSHATTWRMALVYQVFRGVHSITSATYVTPSEIGHFQVDAAAITSTVNGSMLAAFANGILSPASTPVAPLEPPSFTLTSGFSVTQSRLSAAYRSAANGVAASGQFDLGPGQVVVGNSPNTHKMASITLLLAPDPAAERSARILATGPLGRPFILSKPLNRVRVLVASPLRAAAVQALQDFTGLIARDTVDRYALRLYRPSGPVIVPISSWQATLRSEEPDYVQCVVPSAENWIDQILDATSFEVLRRGTTATGGPVEQAMASAPMGPPSLAQGTRNYSATISGYNEQQVGPANVVRELKHVRVTFVYPAGHRVRCAIDWLLRPGHTASFDGTSFVIRYISYYVRISEGGSPDAFMDVGE